MQCKLPNLTNMALDRLKLFFFLFCKSVTRRLKERRKKKRTNEGREWGGGLIFDQSQLSITVHCGRLVLWRHSRKKKTPKSWLFSSWLFLGRFLSKGGSLVYGKIFFWGSTVLHLSPDEMGGCIGAHRDNGPPSGESSDVTGRPLSPNSSFSFSFFAVSCFYLLWI